MTSTVEVVLPTTIALRDLTAVKVFMHLCGGDEAIAVFVKYLEGLTQLLLGI